MNVTPLAQALGWPDELTERAARALYDERRRRREANRYLQPYMANAIALYHEKGDRLQRTVLAAKLARRG